MVLLERADRVGGAAGSITVAGIRADLGSHRLHPTVEPRILAELRRLLGDDLQWRPRNGRIRLAGRWIAFPLRPADLLRRMPPGMAVGIARDTALGPLRRPRADTFAEVLRAALGPTICDRFYFPYARKIWGAARAARRRAGAPARRPSSPAGSCGACSPRPTPRAAASCPRGAATASCGRRSPTTPSPPARASSSAPR